MWINHAHRIAQDRALGEKGREYILLVKIDNAEVPGAPPAIGYLTMERSRPKRIADMLVQKLR